jgi:glyceraldehyde-3-phosphate dehydrogenase (ferredoxin)
LSVGVRKWARRLQKQTGKKIIDKLLYNSNGRKGWMVPNQYWTPGVLAPMAIMGKYYMYYGNDFVPPRTLGNLCADRFKQELIIDNMGVCRFHRAWAEDMLPEIVGHIYDLKDKFLSSISYTASLINSRNSSVFLESEMDIDFIHTYLKRKRDVDGETREELIYWIEQFDKDKYEAAMNFWYEIRKGIDQNLRDFK